MNGRNVFYGMIGLLVLLVCLNLGAVVMGKSMLQDQSDKLLSLKVDDEVVNEQQTALAKAQKDIAQYAVLDQIARTIVPQDKDQAKAIREITSIASKLGIPIQNITFPNSTLGQTAPTTDGTSTSSNTSKTSVTQVQPVVGILGVYQIPISVQSDINSPVTFSQLISFLKGLELNRRTSQVTNINVNPNSDDRNRVNFTLTINEFVKP